MTVVYDHDKRNKKCLDVGSEAFQTAQDNFGFLKTKGERSNSDQALSSWRSTKLGATGTNYWKRMDTLNIRSVTHK